MEECDGQKCDMICERAFIHTWIHRNRKRKRQKAMKRRIKLKKNDQQ